MQNIKRPEGYPQVSPYLIVKNAAGFIAFMQAVFGAEEKMRHMRDEHIIMHAELQLGDSIIMLAESTEQYGEDTAGMFVYVGNADETYDKALKQGAESIMPPADQSYGRSCGIMDPFGNRWWITSVTE